MSVYKLLTRRRVPGICRRPRRWSGKNWQGYFLKLGVLQLHLASKRGFGISIWAVQKEGFSFPWWPGAEWYGDMASMKKRKPADASSAVPHLAALESNVFSKLHALVKHCAVTQFDDGDARKPGWWTVRTRGSAWEVEVKDPETCSRLVVIQQTLDDALALASVLLEADDAPWEPDPWLAQQAGRQKRKS